MKEISYKLFFKAFSNETRFWIVRLLRKGPRCVTEICEELDFEQSRVSHNLRCLENCGFVTATQDGKKKVYSLDEKTILPMLELIDEHIEKYNNHLHECGILKKERGAIDLEKLPSNSTEKARSTLNSIRTTIDMDRKRGRGLSEKEDRIRRFILEEFPNLSRAPTVGEISKSLDIPQEEVISTLHKFDRCDIIYLKPGTNEISGAYPFSNSKTDHLVTMKGGDGDKTVNAMCAIDALGVPFMFGGDVDIDSKCGYCGRDVHIEIRENEITDWTPGQTKVWVGRRCGGHAATSICTTLAFFCSDDHIKSWRDEHPDEEGEVLSLGEALFVGKSIFEDFLETSIDNKVQGGDRVIDVKILEVPGCACCGAAIQIMGRLKDEYQLNVEVIDLNKHPEFIQKYNIRTSPGILIDGKLELMGEVSEEEVREKLEEAR